MTDMVERVARTIHAIMFPDEPQGDVWGGMGTIEGLKSIEAARAAIEAMREPTEAMQSAGYESACEEYDQGGAPGYSGSIWRAMIDAALKQ